MVLMDSYVKKNEIRLNTFEFLLRSHEHTLKDQFIKSNFCDRIFSEYIQDFREFNIQFSSSPRQLLSSMQVGCSIDDRSLAMHYNKTTAMRPILGHGIVIEGIPKLLPMVLGEDSKWTGAIP